MRSHFVCFSAVCAVSGSGIEDGILGCKLARWCCRGKQCRPDCFVGWVRVGGGEREEGRVPAGERGWRLVAEDEGLEGAEAVW